MDIEISAICKSAQYKDDVIILDGVFNALEALQLPSTYSMCAVIRSRFNKSEYGSHFYSIEILAPSGRRVKQVGGSSRVYSQVDDEFASCTLFFDISDVQVSDYGIYRAILEIDHTRKGEVPFIVSQLGNRPTHMSVINN